MARRKNEPRERIGQYEVMCVFNEPSPRFPNAILVCILASIDADNPMKYQVKRKNSSVQFATYRDAMNHIRSYSYIKI